MEEWGTITRFLSSRFIIRVPFFLLTPQKERKAQKGATQQPSLACWLAFLHLVSLLVCVCSFLYVVYLVVCCFMKSSIPIVAC